MTAVVNSCPTLQQDTAVKSPGEDWELPQHHLQETCRTGANDQSVGGGLVNENGDGAVAAQIHCDQRVHHLLHHAAAEMMHIGSAVNGGTVVAADGHLLHDSCWRTTYQT
mmetsp:Transcript_5105/g.10710  ORF Transcript_5105/g.10710 Transcript_5105/m.10710 type:complete len:110 (-) Transcript_5105:997-1326(-)